LKEAVDLLRQKELFRPLSKENINENVSIALESYESDLENLYYKKYVSLKDIRELVKEIINEI
jgi:hypothetical protein